jgi:hypothetical protein
MVIYFIGKCEVPEHRNLQKVCSGLSEPFAEKRLAKKPTDLLPDT